MTIREVIYEIVKEVYPDITLDAHGEPDSVLVYELSTEYRTAGELIPVVHYEGYRAVADKRSVWRVHFYASEFRDYAEFERVLALRDRWQIEGEPSRKVQAKLLNKKLLSAAPLWEVAFEVEVLDQVYVPVEGFEIKGLHIKTGGG